MNNIYKYLYQGNSGLLFNKPALFRIISLSQTLKTLLIRKPFPEKNTYTH